jgi:anti-anti-sigma factor
MILREEAIGAVRLLEVRGRIDSTTAPALHEKLLPALAGAATRLLLDLERLEYISSAGFRVLLLAAKQADQTGSRLVLCGLSGKVQHLFEIGGFLDLFLVHGSRDEGLAAIG